MFSGRQGKLKDKKKRLVLVNTEIVNKFKNAHTSSSARRHEKSAFSVLKPLLVLGIEVGHRTTPLGTEVSELGHFSTECFRLWTSRAEVVTFHGIPLSVDALIVPASLFSAASQRRYLPPCRRANERRLKFFCQHFFDLEDWQSTHHQ